MNLDNHIVLVTGASRGIGAAIADTLGAHGAVIVGTATSDKGAQAITQRFESAGINGYGAALDVCDDSQIESVLTEIKERYGAVTVLVNNAGIARDNLLLRMKVEEWDDIINTNLSAVYKMSKACLRPMMKARTGRIISIGSVVGTMGNPGQTNYCAAKAGLVGFSKSLAREVGSRGITVNVVAPGFIQTDMTDELTEDHKQVLSQQIPMAKLGQPQDIANAVLFLASDMAAYISGETIHVNGGMVMV